MTQEKLRRDATPISAISNKNNKIFALNEMATHANHFIFEIQHKTGFQSTSDVSAWAT
jgi:hypothetical protein